MLEAYERIVPGSAARIFDAFPAQSQHRRRMERILVVSDAVRSLLGVLVGGGLSVYIIYTGAQLLLAGHDVSGFGAIGTAIAMAGGTFLVRTRIQSTERMAHQARLGRDSEVP